MAGPRSPSPVLTRPKTNPNLRASENTSSIRRSFTGNPFARPSVHTSPRSFVPNTPANSPAEFGRKLKEGSARGFEEKENEKVLNKAMKCKSPLRTTKSFMSPTISAASKFTPSPRKKILGERNESIRTSISFSDGQESSVSDFDKKSEIEIDHSLVEGASDLAGFDEIEVFKAPSVPKVSKRVTFSDEVLPIAPGSNSPVTAPYQVPETPNKADKQQDYDSVILDSSLDPELIFSPAIAPLDADPSFSPYDPKTNYLSPRPQFLRYKPNRRIEAYLDKEGPNFEESEEFEVTKETEYGELQKESEDGSTTDTLSLSSEEEEEALPLEQNFEENASKQGFFTRSKCISLLLLLLIACVSVYISDVPFISSPVIKDSSFYMFYKSSEVAALARKKIDKLAGLVGNFQHWYESSDIAIYANKYSHGFARDFKLYAFQTMSYLSKLIPRTGEVDKSSSLQFCNLTDSQEHSVNVGYFEVNGQKKVAEINDQYELKPMVTDEAGRDYMKEKAHSANVFNDQNTEESEVQTMSQAKMKFSEEIETELQITESEDQSADVNEHDEEESKLQKLILAESNTEEVFDLEQLNTELQSNTESEDQSADVNEHDEEETKLQKIVLAEMYVAESNTEEVSDLEQLYTELQSNTESEDQSVLDSPAPEVITHVEFVHPTVYNVEEVNPKSSTSMVISEVVENKPFVHAIFGISFLVLAIMVASTFIYLKQGKKTTVNDAVHVEPKQTTLSHQESYSRNSPTNSDMCEESCSYEMSSFQNTSLQRMNKAQTKRESLESSSEFSTGSPSYGSFTTYERIPLKHASENEDIVTPVRRSSRIRSKFTSP